MKVTDIEELKQIANNVRKDIIEETYNAKSGHPGGSLSVADILTVLYFNQMNVNEKEPNAKTRDRLVLSKGHVAPALYAVLAEKGYFEKDELNINGKKVLYRSIKKVQIIENKNKYHLIIRAKGNEYLYKTNQKNSQHVLECLKKYCPRIDKNRD